MTALVVLYMSDALLLPDRVGGILGFGPFRAALEAVTGPLSTRALAALIFGLYAGLVYFTPVLGGLVADRLLGARRTVVLGALLLSAGHLAMAFDASFLAALGLLIVGCGCLKGNISAQVGRLYRPDDAAGRTRGFALFSMAINAGAVGGPLVTAALAQAFGWHAGFGLAAVLMLVGLATYLAGLRHLPPDSPRRGRRPEAAALGPAEWRVLGLLGLVIALSIFQSIAYYQCFDAGLL